MPENPTLSRHQAQQVLWSIDDHTTPQQIEEAIELGADPNEEDDSGRSPLTAVLEDLAYSQGTLVKILDALLEGGANPLAGDCAFERAMTNGTWSPIALLANRALRDDMRTDEGGTVLHAACRQLTGGEQSTALLRLLDMGKELSRDLDLPDLAEIAWQADDEGNTPLHVLWTDGAAVDRMHATGEPAVEEGELSAHWHATITLMNEGANLETANHAGDTVLDLIRRAREAGFPDPTHEHMHEGELARLLSVIDHQQLDHQTTPANKKPANKRL